MPVAIERDTILVRLVSGKLPDRGDTYLNKKNELHAIFLSKDRLYCKWRLQPFLLNAAFYCEQPLNPEVMDLRIFDVTDIHFDGTNAHAVTCMKIGRQDKDWTIKGLKKDRSYICELGYLTKDFTFWPILQSHPVHTSYEFDHGYIVKLKAAEDFYYHRTGVPNWVEHPDCRQTS
ncbi:hypothetical protein B1B05_02700 [Domibacillus enclensis]|uniref:Uncharacterized protein n=1 Tax=Domibacillus enclensis TaxID=1017273 RepID=A0A1N6PLI0_9BACI|nr:hypothetical protein B1B05_02700 [Domibacillus enclensis]SIQ05069.1 protein of unknown function [Domibacillus enclensis]